MTKFAIAGGHSKKAAGASCYINEYRQDRKVTKYLLAELRRRGHTAVDCSNEEATVSDELARECSRANNSGADSFAAIHFNAATKTKEARGVEVWYYDGSTIGKKMATSIAKKLSAALGLPNRGAKATRTFCVLKHTDMPAVLVETCFVDSRADNAAYRKLGAKKVAAAIADGIEAVTGKAK